MSEKMALKLAYIGLGNMGLPMATNLVAYAQENKLAQLVVWNRSEEKYANIPAAKGVDNPEDVIAEQCNVIFTSFANDQAAEEVYEKLLVSAAGKGGLIFVDQSTLKPTTSGTSSMPNHSW